jgi:hypothetical protein
MTVLDFKDYGQFAPIVSVAGTILAMGAALRLGWKGRAKWEPIEEDVSSGPQKVASLVAALMIVLIWVQWNDDAHRGLLVRIVVDCSIALIVSLIIYGLLQGYTYEKVRKKAGEPDDSINCETIRVIGGLWLRKYARKRKGKPEDDSKNARPLTVKRMFALSEYDKDDLWPPASQQFAKMLFTLAYLGLMITGTVALGSGAILAGLSMKK